MYLRDTYDHVVQTTESVEIARELVNGLMNTYLSVVSNRMNDVMKTLTIVASIFVPLTFMAGIYGMNFDHMPELHARWAYPALLGAMGLTTIGMLVYFWRKGWIARKE
jgi:magnesium transporter